MTPEEVKLASAVERLSRENDADAAGLCKVRRADVRLVLRALDERTAERDEARSVAERALQGESDARALVLKETFGEGGPVRVLAAVQARESRLREALREVKERKNQVCPEYELCDHPVCRSSYEAFAIADAALSTPADMGALREFGMRCVALTIATHDEDSQTETDCDADPEAIVARVMEQGG